MTCYDLTTRRSAADLPYELAAERHAALRDERERTRASIGASRVESDPTTVDGGVVHQVRRVVGRRIVAIGSAIDPSPLSRPTSRPIGR